MSEETAKPVIKKPRAKPEGARNFVVKIEGKEWLLRAESFRVADAADLDKALDGKLPRASLTNVVMATSGGRGGGGSGV